MVAVTLVPLLLLLLLLLLLVVAAAVVWEQTLEWQLLMSGLLVDACLVRMFSPHSGPYMRPYVRSRTSVPASVIYIYIYTQQQHVGVLLSVLAWKPEARYKGDWFTGIVHITFGTPLDVVISCGSAWNVYQGNNVTSVIMCPGDKS